VGRDDAVGLRVTEALRGTEWLAIPAPALENVWSLVEKERPKKLVIVDAAEMNLLPGTIRRLPIEKSAEMLGSTHGLPLPFLLSLVRVPEVVLIGIQPKEYGIGKEMSPEVRAAADFLIRLLRENREHEVPALVVGENPLGPRQGPPQGRPPQKREGPRVHLINPQGSRFPESPPQVRDQAEGWGYRRECGRGVR